MVSNAIKFRSAERPDIIYIKTDQDGEYVVITVKDNGLGIPEDKQAEIFSKYFRVENAIDGSGIGLFLVKEIVTQAGGKISVNSQTGEGSTFTVRLKAD